MRRSLLLTGIVTAALVGLAWAGVATALDVGQKAPEFTVN